MYRIEEKLQEIMLKEIPVFHWAGFFFFFLFLMFILYSVFITEAKIPISQNTKLILLFWSSALSGVSVFILFPVITIKINKEKQSLTIQKKSLVKNDFSVYFFKEIADLIYVKENGKNYRLILPLKNGKQIEISSSGGSKEGHYFENADRLNSYIFDNPDQIPIKLTLFHND